MDQSTPMSQSSLDFSTVPYGYCQCCCGERTSISSSTWAAKGYVKGEPRRFVFGHYGRACRGIAPTDRQRFVPLRTSPKLPRRPMFIEKDMGYSSLCWIWSYTKTDRGYGLMRVNRKLQLAHRWFFEQKHGLLPEGREIHHRCEISSCVNPDHMQSVTHGEHMVIHHRNTSGVFGVCYFPGHAKAGPWWARLRIKGKLTSLGFYGSADEAGIVVQEAKRQRALIE